MKKLLFALLLLGCSTASEEALDFNEQFLVDSFMAESFGVDSVSIVSRIDLEKPDSIFINSEKVARVFFGIYVDSTDSYINIESVVIAKLDRDDDKELLNTLNGAVEYQRISFPESLNAPKSFNRYFVRNDDMFLFSSIPDSSNSLRQYFINAFIDL
ncbi:MAG: hypothetical protein ABJR05_14125 [Balneola sp.]